MDGVSSRHYSTNFSPASISDFNSKKMVDRPVFVTEYPTGTSYMEFNFSEISRPEEVECFIHYLNSIHFHGKIRIDADLSTKTGRQLLQAFCEWTRDNTNITVVDLHLMVLNRIENDALKHLRLLTKLESLQVSGDITDEALAHLPMSLRGLNLSQTRISGYGLDKYLPSLKSLESLCLQHVNVHISPRGLNFLALLPNLKGVDLSNTKIADYELKPLSQLGNLEILDLSATQITGEGLRELGRLPNLKVLNLVSSRGIAIGGLKYLDQFPNLELLDLRCTEINEEELKYLAPLKNMRFLNLGHLPLTDNSLKYLNGLKELESLDLRCTSISGKGEGFTHLQALTKLKELKLSITPLVNEGLASLSALTNLQSLGASSTRLTNDGMKYLRPFINLEKLDLSFTEIRDEGLVDVGTLTALTSLDLSFTHIKSPAAVVDGLSTLTKLRSLDVGRSDLALPAYLRSRLTTIPNLKVYPTD